MSMLDVATHTFRDDKPSIAAYVLASSNYQLTQQVIETLD